MLFSQRKGLKPTQKLAQVAEMDTELRNGLWTALCNYYWYTYEPYSAYRTTERSSLETLFNRYWHAYFKLPVDTIPTNSSDALKHVRSYFFGCPWNEVYDFIEFTASNGNGRKDGFRGFCNSVLERENSAYRFVNDSITEITSVAEIESVEEALEAVSGSSGVKAHLTAALELLSDRKNPDYRNSIKESISAVEAISQMMTQSLKLLWARP